MDLYFSIKVVISPGKLVGGTVTSSEEKSSNNVDLSRVVITSRSATKILVVGNEERGIPLVMLKGTPYRGKYSTKS